MEIELLDWNVQDTLKSRLARRAYLAAALAGYSDDPDFIKVVLSDLEQATSIHGVSGDHTSH